jgi:hypothetical protein
MLVMAKRISLALLAIVVASCSARQINPQVSNEYDRSMIESFGLGLGSIAAGASAPVTCGIYYTLWPLQNLQGQGAIGIYFLPFTGLFGVIVGTARAVPMVALGTADVATLGAADLSAEYLYSYNGFGQWCACMHTKCVEPPKDKPSDNTNEAPQIEKSYSELSQSNNAKKSGR